MIMKYNFDEVVDRKGTYSCKLDQMPEGAPSDALSVWVADMDLIVCTCEQDRKSVRRCTQ